MANQPTRDIYSGNSPDFLPFYDFAWFTEMSRNRLTETAKLNSKLSTTLQALAKEWTEFIGARLHEDSELLQTLRECRALPNMQRAYVQFLEKAFSQYGEETQRLMRITQGAMEEAAHIAQERMEEAAHIAQERIDVTNGNARASGASRSMPPSSMKRVSPSHRDRS
jgi:hypothetical protein